MPKAPRDSRSRSRRPRSAGLDVLVRDGRDGTPLVDAPLAIRFGEPGTHATRDTADAGELGDIGTPVPFGVDCATGEVAIVVPVYDAPALVARCLDSLLAHTAGNARLIVIDDASPDPAIAPLLARYASRANVGVLRNEAQSRLHGDRESRHRREAGRADVVLLNADTEVGSELADGPAPCGGERGRRRDGRPPFPTMPAHSRCRSSNAKTRCPRAGRFEDTARALWHRRGPCVSGAADRQWFLHVHPPRDDRRARRCSTRLHFPKVTAKRTISASAPRRAACVI